VDWKNGGRQAGRNFKTTMRESEPNRERKRERRVKEGVGPSDIRQSAGRSHTFIYLVAIHISSGEGCRFADSVGVLYCEMYECLLSVVSTATYKCVHAESA